MNEDRLILSLQFQLDSEKKTNREYNILIGEQQNEITNLKNNIIFLEKELNKFREIQKTNKKTNKETNKEESNTFFKRVSGWIYRS